MKKILNDLVDFFDLNRKDRIVLNEFKEVFFDRVDIFDLIFHNNQNLVSHKEDNEMR